MQTAWIGAIISRDLKTLKRELEAYADERDLWKTAPGITNSTGTLALHLCGNLQHFVGAKLGTSGYVRNRPAEFASRDVPRAELLRLVDATLAAVEQTLGTLRDGNLVRPYTELVAGFSVQTGDFLVHLISHLTYHLGQVDYHRRFVTGDAKSVAPVAIPELASAVSAGG